MTFCKQISSDFFPQIFGHNGNNFNKSCEQQQQWLSFQSCQEINNPGIWLGDFLIRGNLGPSERGGRRRCIFLLYFFFKNAFVIDFRDSEFRLLEIRFRPEILEIPRGRPSAICRCVSFFQHFTWNHTIWMTLFYIQNSIMIKYHSPKNLLESCFNMFLKSVYTCISFYSQHT